MLKKILVIDDEELIIRSLAKLLEKNGFNVFVAKTGEDAIVIADEEDFDLLIADIRMPGMDGTETVEAISKGLQNRGKKKLPVIFITGYADETTKEKAGNLNPVAYIYKPFDISVLVGKVKEVLG
ncbi:MAG: response regulator [Candidatus Omnitrophica bacterium]|nr:response regulator [Candidatus Omnitrophota bacterium]